MWLVVERVFELREVRSYLFARLVHEEGSSAKSERVPGRARQKAFPVIMKWVKEEGTTPRSAIKPRGTPMQPLMIPGHP